MAEDGCSTKLPTPQLYPWLMISHADGERSAACTFYSFLEKSYYTTHVPEISTHGIRMMTSCNEWLVLQDQTNFEFFLLSIASLEKIKLPKIRWTALREEDYFIMTAPPTSPNFLLILFSLARSRALIWRRGRQKWKKLGYDPQDRLVKLAVCNQKIYGIGQFHNFVACEIVDDTLKITKLGRIPRNKFRKLVTSSKHLIGSEGDIFWVQISRHPWSEAGDVKFVDVYKFDQTNGAWNQVQSIDGRVFFLNGAHSISCSVANSDIKENCIHFFVNDFAWYTYDMVTNKLVISVPCQKSYGRSVYFQIIMVQP